MKILFNHSRMIISVLAAFGIVVALCNCSKESILITEVKVSDFGAVINDGQNDTPAIISAIEACKGKKNVKLVFDFGRYDIYGGPKDERGRFQPSFSIDSIHNMTIEGNGAEMIGHEYSTIFNFSGCNNLKINNLTVDWDPVPFTQGKVVKLGTNYVDVEVLQPFTAQAGRKTDGLLGYDPDLRRMARRYTDHYQKGDAQLSEIVKPGVMRVFIGQNDRFAGVLPPVGKHIIIRHQIYGNQSFQFSRCTDIQVENVTIYSNPGMGVTGSSCRNISIRHLNVMIRPGSGRWMSCTADATHFIGCRGAFVMENCFFEGMGDDATNINSGSYMVIAERLDDRRLSITGGTRGGIPRSIEIGDKLELSGEDLVPYATVTVQSAERDEEKRSLIVELIGELPENTVKGDIIGNASSCPSIRIRNCMVIRSRARGFLIKSRDVIIEDCVMQDVSAGAIVMETDIKTWWESIGTRDVIIRNNKFIDCRFERAFISGVIECYCSSDSMNPGVHQRLNIENNIIQGSNKNAIKIGSADSVNITGNIIDGSNEDAILLVYSRNVLIRNNKLTNSMVGFTIGEGCEPSTINIDNNIGF